MSISVQLGWLPPQAQYQVPGQPSCEGQLVPMSRPCYYKRLLFPAAGRQQALPVWLGICSPPLSSTLEGCLAALRMALAGSDSSLVLEIALFPSAAQAPCHTRHSQPSETTEDTFFSYGSSGPTPRCPLPSPLLLDNWQTLKTMHYQSPLRHN